MKRVILGFIILICILCNISNTYATTKNDVLQAGEKYGKIYNDYKTAKENNAPDLAEKKKALDTAKGELDKVHDEYCKDSKNCLESEDFMLNLNDITPGGKLFRDESVKSLTFTQRVNWFLGNIIQKLVMAIGVVAVFIMTIGGGYMVINFGQDELINKGKNIFLAGIYAVVAALASYIIVELVRNLIY